jgi:2-hydroxy-3-keto-5-methylthiopentenyl-1-phosphate phosphatase
LNAPKGFAESALEAGRIPDGRRMRYPPSRRDRPEKTVNQQENSKIPDDRPLAVFCDFDGTFSMQDVGSTLAQKLLPEKRKQLWKRFEQGEFTAWTYAMALLDGLKLPEKDLDRFLETIDLDPGARALLDWCTDTHIPFRILSDGFDWNLERLQAMNHIRFDYQANHLEYAGEFWKLRAGRPNDACGCGTGSCKRGLIAFYREENPGAFCVHIGNGRVSDLCGALEADLAFAKDTLAPALEEAGHPFVRFDTLHDVLKVLSSRGGGAP